MFVVIFLTFATFWLACFLNSFGYMQEPAVVNFDAVLRTIVKGSPLPLGYALARLGHCLGRVKIWVRITPYGPKYGVRKKSIWVGAI